MRLLCTLLMFFLAVVWSISAAPLIDVPIAETLPPAVTDIPELIVSSTISILPDSNLGTVNPALLVDLLPITDPTSTVTPVIISQYSNADNGNYEHGYKTSNGIEVEEKGSQKEIVGENGEKVFGTVSSGKYSYIVDDGSGQRKKVTVTWTADENGFRPVITYSDYYETKTGIP